jgi:hypothetical protein
VDAPAEVCDSSCFSIIVFAESDRNHYNTVESIRGFALDPGSGTGRGWVTILPEYNSYQLSRGLREPCQQTCQRLMMSFFREGEEEKCLFTLEHMDELENGQKPNELKNKKRKKGEKPGRTKG